MGVIWRICSHDSSVIWRICGYDTSVIWRICCYDTSVIGGGAVDRGVMGEGREMVYTSGPRAARRHESVCRRERARPPAGFAPIASLRLAGTAGRLIRVVVSGLGWFAGTRSPASRRPPPPRASPAELAARLPGAPPGLPHRGRGPRRRPPRRRRRGTGPPASPGTRAGRNGRVGGSLRRRQLCRGHCRRWRRRRCRRRRPGVPGGVAGRGEGRGGSGSRRRSRRGQRGRSGGWRSPVRDGVGRRPGPGPRWGGPGAGGRRRLGRADDADQT